METPGHAVRPFGIKVSIWRPPRGNGRPRRQVAACLEMSLAEHLRAGPDRGRIEPGRERGQGRVEIEGQVGVGPGGPSVVSSAADGQGGPADGERVERVGGLADAGRGEIADGAFPCVVVDGGTGLQAGTEPIRFIRIRSSGTSCGP